MVFDFCSIMKHVETLKALKVAKSPNQKQKLQQETKLIGLLVNVNHMEKRKKKKPKAGNREKNKSCGRKKKRKKKWILTLTSVT